jgi:hypothetical protein
MISAMLKSALQYVRNTGGGATVEIFIEDHDPIGKTMWSELNKLNAVKIVDNKIYLSDIGDSLLN